MTTSTGAENDDVDEFNMGDNKETGGAPPRPSPTQPTAPPPHRLTTPPPHHPHHPTEKMPLLKALWESRKAVMIGFTLMIGQQLAGINAVMFYCSSILSMAGMSNQVRSGHGRAGLKGWARGMAGLN